MSVLRALGNVVWFLLAGWWLALVYVVAAIVMFVLIITAPFGVQALKLAGFVAWPYGRTVVESDDAVDRRGFSAFANVLWLLFAGIELAVAHIVAGVVMFISIVGIPFGIASFKMVPLAMWPFGREVVTIEEANRRQLDPIIVVTTS